MRDLTYIRKHKSIDKKYECKTNEMFGLDSERYGAALDTLNRETRIEQNLEKCGPKDGPKGYASKRKERIKGRSAPSKNS